MAARTTKKDLESKIALLEKKLQKLTDSVDLQKTSPKPASVKPKGTLPKGTAPKPTPEYVKPKGTLPKTTASAPKPAPAQTKPKGTMPKGFTPESASKPKPAETKNAPTNMAQALEKAYENWPMTSTADYKAKTPGYTPAPNRYFARQHGVVGKTTTKDWNIQKKAVTGYTAASDQYQTILLVPLHTLCAVESLQSPSLDPLVLKFVSILRHSREHLQAHRHLLWAWCMMP